MECYCRLKLFAEFSMLQTDERTNRHRDKRTNSFFRLDDSNEKDIFRSLTVFEKCVITSLCLLYILTNNNILLFAKLLGTDELTLNFKSF